MSWHGNKIKAGIAEAACREHFEALGYAVESFGIENIAPQYCRIANMAEQGEYLKEFQGNLQNMPDFLISRITPASADNAAGKAEAILVDAKYKESVVLTEFDQEIRKQYQNLLDKGISFLIYLVARAFRFSPTAKLHSNYVHVGLYRKVPVDRPWLSAGEGAVLNYPLYVGIKDGENFNTVYATSVHPCLDAIFNSERNQAAKI